MPKATKAVHSNHRPKPNSSYAIAILAAGKGTRLKSKHPKVLHRAGGKPLLEYVTDAALRVAPAKDVYAIVGHEAERVQQMLTPSGINFVLQRQQRGTGHAIMAARTELEPYSNILVLSGDVPLIRPQTIELLREFHETSQAAMTILATEPVDPAGYGRIIRQRGRRGTQGEVARIVEQRSATPAELKIREINSGIYFFSSAPLFSYIDQLTTENPHGEFYLTDMAAILVGAGERVMCWKVQEPFEVLGVNTRSDLAQVDAHLRNRKCAELMRSGVTIYRPDTCIIDDEVAVEPDTIIEPFVQLLGNTQIGADCQIRSYSVIANSQVADDVTVRSGCILTEAKVGRGAILGPYCHLRPGSHIGEAAHVGNFVETKKTSLGNRSKANHLSYLGDATIGANVNVGAGTITCNFDGMTKHPTIIEDEVFVGSDSILVAPVTIGRRAYIAAASCVTEDVPPDALALGRARQVNKQGWSKQKREQMAATKK